ncbi:MAG: hypothetical protein EOO13_03400 [Chitinophagaceae bacterium]|nr:MAG: hypothetical protein EOO13_03400 [Chitinophagaceae bacterium]
MILVYKTNINSKAKAKKTEKELNRLLQKSSWNFDLEDCDNILRVDSEKDVTKILKGKMREFGVEIEELPD